APSLAEVARENLQIDPHTHLLNRSIAPAHRTMLPASLLGDRRAGLLALEFHAHGRAASCPGERGGIAAVRTADLTDDGEPHPRGSCAGRVVGEEDVLPPVLGDAWAAVGELEARPLPACPDADLDLP